MNHAAPKDFRKSEAILTDRKPRVRVCVVARLSGLTSRHITSLASKDMIPGAAKHGGIWTFDQDLLALWIDTGNKWQSISTNQATANITISAPPLTEKNTDSRFRHLLSGRRKRLRTNE